jgi:hypothetical protein
MIALRRTESLTYGAILAFAIAASCAKAEDSPLADQGDDDGGGKGGTSGTAGSNATGGTGGTSGSTGTGGSSATGGTTSSGGKGGTSTGGTAGKGGTTSTGGTSAKGGTGGSVPTTYGCLDGEGGEGGQSGGAPGEGGAGGAGPTTLFIDDFEDGDADGWSPTAGSWSIASDGTDVYQQSDAGSTSQYLSAFAGTCWDDQVVEARVKIVSFGGNSTSNAAGVYARYVSAQTHYLIGMDSGNNGELFIGRRIQSTSSAPERVATKTNMHWVAGTWYTLRLEVIGSSLKAYLDDALQLETTDTQITSGGVALGARHVNVRFDDVRVTRP